MTEPTKLPDGNPESVTTNTPDLVEVVNKWLMSYTLKIGCPVELTPEKMQPDINSATRELIALMPFDEIRELVKGIDKRIYKNGWIPPGDKVGWDLDKIIALLPDPPKPEMSMRDEVRCVLLDCLKEFKSYQCISNFNITNYMDSIMAIVKGGGGDE